MTMETHRCEKCDQSFTDSELFACHPCSERLTATSNQKDLGKYKCSQCSEFFFKPGNLKHHFISIHSGRVPEGPFLCTQSGCQVSSTNQQDYHVHLRTVHGLNLIPCTVQSCSASFLTQDEMEGHKQVHMPFGCFHCQFVAQNVKDLSDHVLKHSHLPDSSKGNETATTCLRTNVINDPQWSGNPKRKPISSPSQASSLPEDGIEEPLKRQKHKKRDRTAVDTAPLPSKEYLAEGSEHIYRTHTCPKCRRCFKMRSHLQEHLHLHFPDPTLQCPTCKRYFSSKSKLRIHRLRESGEKVHRCHLCEYSAMERNAIRRHLVTVHAEEAQDDLNHLSYPCPTCGQRFHQSRLLKAHMKTHNVPSESKQLTCFQQDCTFQSSSSKDLLQHAANVHGVKALECRGRACGAIFQSQAEMESHYRTHLAYHCSQCDYSCSNKAVFLQHQRHGHPGNDKLCCDFCSFVTFNPVEFEQHIGHLHANEKIYHCSHCSYATSHKRSLTRHMLLHSGEKPHKCSVCDYRCRDVSYLSKHMLTHSEDKNFMCAQCGYVTKWKHSLNVHMRKHAGDLRYQCDQCTYRSHRMDQLNSHKLRHQAKTLICEICAFACKRKYELRNHMLAKHSGEGRQISLLKCTYCTYTTCYRQALQNHENCKHTKLKEFRCALCSYSSYSSISLFLHKRKVHGYVPGDKEWLENYAAREKERNSAEFMMDFYKNSPITPEQFKHSSSEGPLPSLQERKETGTGSQIDSVDVLDVVSQEVVSDSISDGPTAVEVPEQYCTIVLTTLSNSADPTPSLQNEQDNCTNPVPTSPTLKYNGSDISLEKTDLSPSSAEEDSAVMADAECQRELSDVNSVDLTNKSQPGEFGHCQAHRDGTDGRRASSTLERKQPLETELCLKKNNNNKEHAEAMFLDGRVQMLVVPNKDVYHCDTCSYVTRNKTALKYHCQALCHGRIKEYKCQACGALFKQKRGLDTHHKKKCPALCGKTRTAVGIPKPRDSTVGHNVFTQLHKIRQTGLRCSLNGTCTDSDDQELNHHRAEVFSSHLTDCKEKLLDHAAKEKLFSHNKQKTVPLRSLYTKIDGKFKCKLCNFSAVRISTVERHLSVCRKRENLIVSEADDDGGNESIQSEENIKEECCKRNRKTSGKRQIFSCPSCAFKCDQKRALDCHERSGCLKPDEVQCTLCSFVAKSKMSLTRHILYVHKKEHHKKKFVVAKQKRLHCQHCNFTCKQGRCMVLHVALKHKGVRPHRCQYCPFSTTRHYRLQQHESLHTGIGRHSCSICERTFGTVTKLRQHKIRIHDKQPTHFCSLCDFSGYALDDVRRHNQRCHSGALQHSCSHCVAQFNSEVALRNHCKRVHQLQAWLSCNQCDYTCSSDVTLKSHQEIKHPQVKCNTCQEAFKTKESLMVHQRSHLAHQCQLCPFATRTRQLLAQHLLGVHEEGSSEDKPLKCSTCEFVCRHQLVLEQHLRSHGGKRLYKCTDCEYSTRNKQKIAWHIRIHTGEKPYSCELCSYTCTDPSRLKLHMRVHRDEKKYLCPQCGYKCKWATQLKYHLTKHTGEKPYACEECSYRTNRADALRAHRDTQHCDTRPYVCEKCGKAFKTSFILKTHQHQHSNDRPYVCGVCHKAFRWPAGLRHHYLSHTKQQPFCCCHCSYRAKQKFQVVKHLQRHHPGMSTEEGVVRDSEAGSLTLKDALQGTLDESAVEEDESTANEKEAVARGENSDSKMLHCKTLHKS